jgi:hypothetical protein
MANFFLLFLLYSQGNCGMLRNETRLVVMPELQGHGIGPKMAEIQGDGIGPKIQGYLGALPRTSGKSWVMNILMMERPVTTLGAQHA